MRGGSGGGSASVGSADARPVGRVHEEKFGDRGVLGAARSCCSGRNARQRPASASRAPVHIMPNTWRGKSSLNFHAPVRVSKALRPGDR